MDLAAWALLALAFVWGLGAAASIFRGCVTPALVRLVALVAAALLTLAGR